MGSFSNFTILIDIYDTDLHDNTRADGYDILFTDFNGNKLDHEIESYNRDYNTTHAHLTAWVRLSSIGNQADTFLFMYFDNPISVDQQSIIGVWDSFDYQGVWHLNQDPTSQGPSNKTILDSTSHDNDGYTSGALTSTNLIDGKIGQGIQLDGINDLLIVNQSSSLDSVASQGTISVWINWDNPSNGAWQRILVSSNTFPIRNDGFEWASQNDGDHYFYPWSGDTLNYNLVTNPFSQSNKWYSVTITLDYSTKEVKIYINGVSQTFSIENVPTLWNQVTLLEDWLWGGHPSVPGFFAGKLDEIHVVDVVRSSAWIQTEFNNQNNPNSFYEVGIAHSQDVWALEQFSFRKEITLDSSMVSGSTPLYDFPVLMDLTDSDLIGKVQSNGNDIIFTDENGLIFPHEIESYNSGSGRIQTWVKVRRIDNAVDTKFWMYYGNPGLPSQENPNKVWENSYVGVWHLNEQTNSSYAIKDSTSHKNDGNALNGVNLGVTCKITNCHLFDGSNDRIQIDHSSSMQISNQITVEAWIKPNILTKWQTIVSKMVGTKEDLYFVVDNNARLYLGLAPIKTDWPTTSSISTSWQHVVFTYDNSLGSNQIKVFRNGIQGSTSSGTGTMDLVSNTHPLYIGYNEGWPPDEVFQGYIDEVRILNTAKSGDWITTEYRNQNNPSGYFSSGEEIRLVDIFNYRKKITIDNTKIPGSTDFTNFPLLVEFYDSDLFSLVDASGKDIRFGLANGLILPHDFVNFTKNDNGTHAFLSAWVLIPSLLASVNTEFFIYYNNSQIEDSNLSEYVWQQDYPLVYHMEENGVNENAESQFYYDATGNGHNGDQNGTSRTLGYIGYGQDFDGIDDNIFITSTSNLRPQGDVTISGWFKLDNSFDTTSQNSQILVTKYFPGDSVNHAFNIILAGRDYTLQTQPGALIVKSECLSLCNPSSGASYRWTNSSYRSWNAGEWYHFLVYLNSSDTSYNAIYINGQLAMTPISKGGSDGSGVSFVSLDFEGPWKFGHGEVENIDSTNLTNVWFAGQLDEVRIAESSRNAFWSQLIYENQVNPQSYTSISIQEYNFPRILNFGVYDPGDGFPQYWANITSGWLGSISTATIEVDSIPHSMTFNGTYWVYSPASVNFSATYSYQIITATNDLGQVSYYPSIVKQVTFDKDIIDPTIDGSPLYIGSTSNDGIFKVNVSDSWGTIDTVLLNIIDHSGSCGPCFTPSSAVMQFNGVEWINDSIFLYKGTVTYQIVVNDTSGNSFNSGNQTGNVLNKFPSVSNIQLNPTYSTSNISLNLSYSYVDPENDPQSGSEIRWYKNSIHQSAYDNSLTIPSTGLVRGDVWNVSVKPRDGFIFGQLQWYGGSPIQVQNSAPEASVLAISPTTPITSNDLVASWVFFDEDNDLQPANSWIIRWYNNVSGLVSAYNDQLTVPSSNTAKGQEWWYILQVYDGSEYSIEYSLSGNRTIIANSKPSASSVIIQGSPDTTDILNATWLYSDADGDSESALWIIRWYRNGILVPSLNNQASVPAGFTNKSDVWNFTLQVFDGVEYSVIYTSPSKTIINSAPEANTLAITSNPDSLTNLIASWGYFDADGDTQNISLARIRWYRNGLLVSSLNDLTTVPAGLTNKSQVWNYTLQVFDGETFSSIYSSGLTTIQNTAPSVDSATLLTSSSTSSEDLVASWAYSDIDNDAENVGAVRIRWYRDGLLQSGFNDALVIPFANIVRGDQWNFTIEVYDGEAYSSILSSNIVTILNSAPILLSQATFNNTSPADNDDFNISISYYDQDGDTQAELSITWFIFGNYNATLDNSTTINQYETATGQFWSYQIRVFDGFVWSILYTSRTIGIGQPSNNKPIVGNLTLISLSFTPFTTDVLNVDYDYFDIDGHPEYQTEIFWYMDNGTGFVLQPQHNGSFTILSSFTKKGEQWIFTIIPKDVFGAPDGVGDPVNSSIITIINSVPTASGLQITTNPNNNTPIIANYIPNDADNDDLTPEILWYQNGVHVSALDNQLSVPASYTLKHDEWNYTIRLFDGVEYSLVYNSSITMVINTAPEISGFVTITPGSPITTETLTANWVYSDLDDDSEGAPIITWYKNGVSSYFNISSILSGNTKKGENWYFIIRVYDGEGYSIQHISATIQIGNTAPVASNIIFNPSTPLRGDNLQITYTWTDADQNVNDIETGTIIRWYRNGTLVPSLNNTITVPGSLITKNYEWNVTIIPSDGTDQGIMIFASILIGNTLPEVNSISIIPGTTTYTTSDLIASYSLSDVDGDSVTVFTIFWYNNSQLVASLTNNATVPSVLTQKHDIWYYTIQVYDGTDLSLVYQSSNITILNSKPIITIFSLEPASPSTLETLTAFWTYSDADGDLEQTPHIRWYNNSILQSPFNDDMVILPSATLKNQIWFYTIEVFDGEEYSDVFVSSVRQIQNSIPTIANFNFTNSVIPTTIDDLEIKYDFIDGDNDFESTRTRIFWYRNGSLQALYNGKKAIPSSATSHFDIWTVTVQPHDGESFGTVKSINITIVNTKPVIDTITYFPTQSAYTTSDLSLSYTVLDVDNDVIVAYRTRWYIGPNSLSLVYNPLYDDLVAIPSIQTVKGEWWAVNISIFDGRDWSDWSVLQIKEIRNKIPIAENILLSPNGTIYTTNTLTLTWNYIDDDNDNESTAYIRWYRNGLLYPSLNDSSIVPFADTSKNDNWYAILQVYDGFNLSVSYTVDTVTIQNSIPVITSAEINNNASTTDVSTDLSLNFVFYDADPLDFDRNRTIFWYTYNITTANWDLQPAFNNLFSVPKENLNKGEIWLYNISVYDGQVWSANLTSFSIVIVNSIPQVENIRFIGNENPNFIVEDEDIRIIYDYLDADSLDLDQSIIHWYVNGLYKPEYDNLFVIPSSETEVNQTWSVRIIPYDGEDNGAIFISVDKTIEDRPDIVNFGFYPTNETEGAYIFWFDVQSHPVHFTTNRPTIGVDIFVENETDPYFSTANYNGTYYIIEWNYENFTNFGAKITVNTTVSSNVRYNNLPSLISTLLSFNYILIDTAAPRVKQVVVGFKDEELISNITFTVKLEEFGSGIQNVTLFYYLEPTTSETTPSNYETLDRFRISQTIFLPSGYRSAQLVQINSTNQGISFWGITVDVDVNSSVFIRYQIQAFDKSGNFAPNAWPDGPSSNLKYTFLLPGFSFEELAGAIGLIMVVMVIFSFIVIKKFRSKELVGLDIEVVMANIQKMKLKDKDVENVMDSHTLGIVISFFDQRHGPIPVLQEPPLLRDNFEKLVELSDLSFSAVRFVDNFEDEVQASFDFTVDERTRVSSISFAYALNRPNARGGAENLTLNILVLKDVYPLVSQFTNQFTEIVSKIHKVMDIDPDAKGKVQKEIFELRKFISKIVLSYVDIYETTELITEETD